MFALPKWLNDIRKLLSTADGKFLKREDGAWVFSVPIFTLPEHAENHAQGGSDPLSPADIGAATPALRGDIPLATGTIGSLESETGAVEMAPAFLLLKVSASSLCRIRLYSTDAARIADSARPAEEPPQAGAQHGVLLDLVLDYNSVLEFPATWILSPLAACSNEDDVTSSNIYYDIQNLGASQALTVTFTIFGLED